jgi:hypothetical protein
MLMRSLQVSRGGGRLSASATVWPMAAGRGPAGIPDEVSRVNCNACIASLSNSKTLTAAHSTGTRLMIVHRPESMPVARTTMSPALNAGDVRSNAVGQLSAARCAQAGSHDGSSQISTGSTAAMANAAVQSACRSAAERRCKRGITMQAASRTIVALIIGACFRAWHAR